MLVAVAAAVEMGAALGVSAVFGCRLPTSGLRYLLILGLFYK